mgnify:CR=1 FL=1
METAKRRVMLIGLDGADPCVLERLIKAGRLPNIEKAVKMGTTTEDYSMLGTLPTVTPPSWSTLATGAYPRTHGVTCYTNHTWGKRLDKVEANWDSRRVEAELIWETFSEQGRRSIMMNYCQAWPPRSLDDKGIYIDGTGTIPFMRCNAEPQKLVSLKEGDFELTFIPHAMKKGNADCVVTGEQFEEMMSQSEEEDDPNGFQRKVEYFPEVVFRDGYTPEEKENAADRIISALKEPENWDFELPQGAKVAPVIMNDGTLRRYFVLTASDGEHYDTITVYKNKRDAVPMGSVQGENWSAPIYDQYLKNDQEIKVAYSIRPLSIAADGSECELYISNTVNMSDLDYFWPQEVGQKLYDEIGPMFGFAKYGRYKEPIGRQLLLESFEQTLDWQMKASAYLFNMYPDWGLFYTHLHGIDLYNHWYINSSLEGSSDVWADNLESIYKMYEANDKFVGFALDQLDGNTSIVIVSDHGAVPHTVGDENPGISNIEGISYGVMEALGYTKVIPGQDGEYAKIDWEHTIAVSQRSSYVYLNLKGREPHGIVEPEDYDQVVQQIISDLYNFRDPKNGQRVVAFCLTRDEMELVGMGGEHCGDILVQLVPTYNMEHAASPSPAKNEGFSLGLVFILAGSGIKQGHVLRRKVRSVDVVPTLCQLAGVRPSSNVEGGVIWQALEGFEEKAY